jgi:cytochrome P450 family 26 subfamily A
LQKPFPNTYTHTAQRKEEEEMNAFFTIFLFLVPIFLLLVKGRKSSNKLPPGSLGIPIIGHSLQFLKAMRTNTAEKWLHERIQKYGSISKLTLFGKPTVFIYGNEAKSLYSPAIVARSPTVKQRL